MIRELDLQSQTLYAELVNVCRQPLANGSRLSFTTKKIKGARYWYLNAKLAKRHVQRYVGPDNQETRQRIAAEKTIWLSHPEIRKQRAKLVRLFLMSGGRGVSPMEGKILQLLEKAGVFLMGGCLVGTPAFLALGNQLGFEWFAESRTQDVDLAHDHRLPVAIGKKPVDLPGLLKASGLGFFEVPAFDSRQPSTQFQTKNQHFFIDFLAPEIGKPTGKPIYLPAIKTYAQPVRFLDFLLENSECAVIPFDIGVVVNVPEPARFALHKLVVSQRRHSTDRIKVKKDLVQAESVLSALFQTQPGSIPIAFDAAQKMGKKFVSQMFSGLKLLTPTIQTSWRNHVGEIL